MRKALAWLVMLVCLMTATGAGAEIQFLPQVEQWDAALPLEIELSVDVKSHMPFDDDRCAQLNALLKHISLKLNTASAEDALLSRVAVRVDGEEALSMLQRDADGETQMQFSFQPGVTYTGSADALLGTGGEINIFGLDGSEQAWLDDCYAMLDAMRSALDGYQKESTIKTAIKNMGTARKKVTYTIPKADAGKMAEAIASHCPEGELRDFLTKLVFSGQQKLIFWLNADGAMLRVEYAGNCGADESSLRKVSLVWRMRRDDTAVRDILTLKTPAVKGNDYNTLTYERAVTKGKKSKLNYDSEFTYTWKSGKEKTTLSGVVDLVNTPSGDQAKLTGTVTVKQTLPGADTSNSVKIIPSLVIGADNGTPVVSGEVTVQELRGKNVLEDAVITLKAGAGTYLDWPAGDETISVAAMTAQQQTALADGMAHALIVPLVLIPAEDVLYLSADLPDEVWQQIVEAARMTLGEEETR